MNRKNFLKNSLGGLLVGLISTLSYTQTLKTPRTLQDPEPLDIKLVKEFVVAGHKNLPLVKEMLNEYPNLIYSSYDWGNRG